MFDNQYQNGNVSNFNNFKNEKNIENNDKLLINPSNLIYVLNNNNNNCQTTPKNQNVFSNKNSKKMINDVVEEEKGNAMSKNHYIEFNPQNKKSIVDLSKHNGGYDQNKNIKNYQHFKFSEGHLKKNNNIQFKNEQSSFNNNNINNNKNISVNIYKNNNNKNKSINNIFNNDNSNEQILLENYGNTTYMIFVLRCLANIESFIKYFLKNKEFFKKLLNIIPVTYAFSRILTHLYPDRKKPFPKNYSIKNFHSIILYLNPIFKGHSTKNAIDFLMYIITQMHEEYKISKNNNKNQNENYYGEIASHNFETFMNYLKENEYSNISNQFGWINKKQEKCWECNKEIITFNNFLTYDLEFEEALNKAILNNKNEISIKDCINFASKEKNIYNVFCNNCNRRNNFIKKSEIYSSGGNLIFIIRGLEKKEVINDIKSYEIKMKINKNLNIFDKAKNKNIFYSINGLVLYDTENLEYIAYSISPIDKKWYKYTKENIIPMDLKDIVKEYDFQLFPAILFYQFEKYL